MAGLESREINPDLPNPEDERIQSNCGLFALIDVSDIPHSLDLRAMTLRAGSALQHRAEGAAGYAAFDNTGTKVTHEKGEGRIDVAFQQGKLIPEFPRTRIAILHTRYPTSGASSHSPNIQPLSLDNITFAHHGNLTNAQEMLDQMPEIEFGGQHPDNDSWTALNAIHQQPGDSLEEKMVDAQRRFEGGWAFIATDGKGVVASRDPQGIRPLFLARIGQVDDPQAFALSVETSAFNILGIEEDSIREVLPGETISIRGKKVKTVDLSPDPAQRSCIFEVVYMMHPDSEYMGQNIYTSRRRAGHFLWQEQPVEVGENEELLVMPVPDSGRASALGYWKEARRELGERADWDEGLLINRYVGRDFIKSSSLRDPSSKFYEIASLIRGRKVVLVDDSLVRGETMAGVVKMLKSAGAREVHIRIASPEIVKPCHWGIAMATYGELAAYRNTDIRERARVLGMDSLGYLSLDKLYEAAGMDEVQREKMCAYCFGGNGPHMSNGDNPGTIKLNEVEVYKSHQG